MIEDTDAARAEMLILAALTYRGFSDVLTGELHEGVVRQQIDEGLARLAPVSGRWDLVWGPVTSRSGDQFDSSAMYVVRSRSAPRRYVVAVRGTNPLSLTDWLFGDFVVAPMVAWPFADDGAAISTSTALGLRTLLRLESEPAGVRAQIGGVISGLIRDAAHGVTGAAEQTVRMVGRHQERLLPSVLDPLIREFQRVISNLAAAEDLPQQVERRLTSAVQVQPSELRPIIRPANQRHDTETLVEFLATQTAAIRGPIEVVVTGHSKGGAIAPALALCLKDMGTSRAGDPGWDLSGQSAIGCVTFAGPTPGNRAFARRIDSELGSAHQRIANTNDVVTHAWEMRQLSQIAFLFEERSVPLERLLTVVAEATIQFDYQHASTGVLEFAGTTQPVRPFVEELIHQHLDAYLDRFDLRSSGIDALTLFVG